MPEARTELSTLLGSLSLLKPELTRPSQLQMLSGAESAAQNLFSIMQKLSDLGDLNHNRLEVQNDPVHVSKLVHRLALLYGEKAQACGVDIEVDVDAGLASVSLDQQKLYRVIANLLDYTLATARPGVFRITVALGADGMLAITLFDTGTGKAADGIFDFVIDSDSPLWQNANGSGSLRLGVYLSRQILRLMGGDLSVQGEPGVGSVWSIALPAERATMASDGGKRFDLVQELKDAEREIAISKAQDQRLLIADDSPSNRLVLTKMLRNAGHVVDAVSDGLEVLAALKERAYAAVLLDLAMPRMDGLTTCERIRALPGAYKDVPLIALTAHASDSDQDRVHSVGFDAYLTKPATDKLLRATVQRVISKPEEANSVKQAHEERLAELEKIMGDAKLRILLEQFAHELADRQAALGGSSQHSDIMLDLPLLSSMARTFGFDHLATVAELLRSEMLKVDLGEGPKSRAADDSQQHRSEVIGPAMTTLAREVSEVNALVQGYIASNLAHSKVDGP